MPSLPASCRKIFRSPCRIKATDPVRPSTCFLNPTWSLPLESYYNGVNAILAIKLNRPASLSPVQPPTRAVDREDRLVTVDGLDALDAFVLVVEYEAAVIRIDDQDGVRDVFLFVLDDGDAQFVNGEAQGMQRGVFGQRIVLAVAAAVEEAFGRGVPVAVFAVFLAVIHVRDLVQEVVDALDLLARGEAFQLVD